MNQAIQVLRQEHRSISSVLNGLRELARTAQDPAVRPDFSVFRAMIYYIDAFPERFHHPKEDEYLFHFLRIRHPDAKPLLDRLQGEHRTGAEKIRTLEQTLARYQQGGAKEFASFLAAVEDYAEFHWQHMKTEENEVMPLARKHLTADDWDAVDAAFLGHTDPMLGIDVGAGFTALFSRIVLIAPPPIGVGPEQRRF